MWAIAHRWYSSEPQSVFPVNENLVVVMKTLLCFGANVNYCDMMWRTPLWHAIETFCKFNKEHKMSAQRVFLKIIKARACPQVGHIALWLRWSPLSVFCRFCYSKVPEWTWQTRSGETLPSSLQCA